VVRLCKELAWIDLEALRQIEQEKNYYRLSKNNSQVNGFFVHI